MVNIPKISITNTPKTSVNHSPYEDKLHTWCLMRVALRYSGDLSKKELDELNSFNFPWEHYEGELERLGSYFKKNTKKTA